jgi:hypothetical protein
MIKFIDILNESTRVKLDPEFKKVLNNVVEVIFKKRKSFRKYTPITTIPIKIADGTPGAVEIAVDPDLEHFGLLDTKCGENCTDPMELIMTINPKKVNSKKNLYQTIYHEMMHATDPMLTTKSTESFWSDYDPDKDEMYWGHPAEFRAITNEFIEALINEFALRRNRLHKQSSIDILRKSLDNILNYFGKGEPLSNLSKDIIYDMYGAQEITNIRKALENIIVDNPDVAELLPRNKKEKMDYITVIDLVKQHSGDDWKRFLGMLVKAGDEIKEILK